MIRARRKVPLVRAISMPVLAALIGVWGWSPSVLMPQSVWRRPDLRVLQGDASTARRLPQSFLAGRGLLFAPNVGQADASIRFIARGPEGSAYFTPSGITLALAPRPRERTQSLGRTPGSIPPPLVIRMRFLGADPGSVIRPGALSTTRANYFLGNLPSRWRASVSTYARITYASLYPKVDLTYAGEGGRLKSTYVVAPSGEPARIRWRYDPAAAPRVDSAGDLHLRSRTDRGSDPVDLVEKAPLAWQDVGGRRVAVAVRYAIGADGSIGFALGRYDRGRPLVIDPTLIYSTYLGGTIADQAWGMAVDGAGNAYVTGYTASMDLPVVKPFQRSSRGQGEAFVAKFTSSGKPVYITYLGGNYVDYANAIAVDGQGNAYVTGWTGSTDFPVANAYQPFYPGNWDAFVTKLDATGSALMYSTYLGGATSGENGLGIAVDSSGSAYVAGLTESTDFPMVSAFQPVRHGSVDAFVTKFAPNGTSLVYSTYLGGERSENGLGIAVGTDGAAYVTGYTTSSDFPTLNAFQPSCAASYAVCWDVFVTKFAASGSALVYSTYLGGNDQEYVDQGLGIAVDDAGIAYVVGWTGSPNFPMLRPYQPYYGGQVDAFLTRFAAGGALLSSTFLGGSNSEVAYAVALDRGSNIAVSGLTLSTDFLTVNPIQPAIGGFEDPFVAKFTANAQVPFYVTYFGGSNGREEYGSRGIGVDAKGNVYITGSTEAADFPILKPYQPMVHGSYDAFIARLDARCGGPGTFRVSGKVTTPDGAPVSGVVLSLIGPGGCGNLAVSDALGGYRFRELPAGVYTVTPRKGLCTFKPSQRTVKISDGNARAGFTINPCSAVRP